MFLFKSEFCPFSKIKHDRFSCVYAHNWQDYKRPFEPRIKPKLCPNWNLEKEVLVYRDGCPNEHFCDYCHGWKELEYHIKNFRKKKCSNAACQR